MTMPETVAYLLQWIALNTGHVTADLPLPEVVTMTPAEITAEYYGAAGLAAAGRQAVDPRIMALYAFEDGPHGTIYVIDPVLTEGADDDPYGNPIFQERLLHELVHHVQRQTGAYDRFLCVAEGEIEAYRLGGTFLRQRNVMDPLPNRNFWAAIYSRC